MVKIKIDYDKGYLTESEVLLLKSRLNNGKITHDEIPFPEDGFNLTPEQVDKGYKWLMNLWVTPTGKERKNNPYGWREMETLKNFKTIKLIEFTDRANYYQHQIGIRNHTPYYEVIAKNGMGFDYLVEGGEIQILG